MRVAGPDDEVLPYIVIFAREKPCDVARRDAKGAKHDGHRGGEILAMTRALDEQKVGQRIALVHVVKIERVTKTGAEVTLDFRGLVIRSRGVRGYLLGKFLDARIERRQLQVGVAHVPGIVR